MTAAQVTEAREQAIASLQADSHEQGKNGEYTLGDALKATVDLLCPEEEETYRHALAAAAEDYEVSQELAHCHAIPGSANFLKALQQKYRVVVVSDTYLEHKTVSRLLESCGLARHIDALYISCEEKANKRSGGLFSHIRTLEGLPPANITHIGDDPVADYLSPSAQGIYAVLLRHKELHTAQASLAHRIELAENLGEMRYLPEFVDNLGIEDKACRLGAEAVGMVIGLFALHILELDRTHKYDRILFVSRDGYLPFLAFREITAHLSDEIDEKVAAKAEYVQLSRLSTLCPQTDAGIEEAMFYSTLVAGQSSALGLFATLGLQTEKYRHLLKESGFSEAELNSAALDTKATLLKTLQDSPILRKTITEDINRKRESLCSYLQQQDFFSSQRILLVDVGWRYKIARNLLEAFGDRADFPELHCALLGYTRELPHPRIFCHPGYLYDALRPHPLERLVLNHSKIIETLCSSLEGTCIGYTDAPKAQPLKAPPDSDPEGVRQRIHAGAHQAFVKIANIYKRYHLGPEFRLAALVELLSPIVRAKHPLHSVITSLNVPTDGWFVSPNPDNAIQDVSTAGSFCTDLIPQVSVSFGRSDCVKSASSELEKLLTLIQKILQSKKPTVLWGFGLVGKLIYPHIMKQVAHVVDADPSMQGQSIGQHTIISPESLPKDTLSEHVIIFSPLGRKLPELLIQLKCEVISVAGWFGSTHLGNQGHCT